MATIAALALLSAQCPSAWSPSLSRSAKQRRRYQALLKRLRAIEARDTAYRLKQERKEREQALQDARARVTRLLHQGSRVRQAIAHKAAGGTKENLPPASHPLPLAAKVGRNAPCPCASGKKFKRCHGQGGATRYPEPWRPEVRRAGHL